MNAHPLRLIAALAAASALSVAALLVEISETGRSFFRFLVWNLFLAWYRWLPRSPATLLLVPAPMDSPPAPA